jgi:DNA-directed RNA polymerase beta subunit
MGKGVISRIIPDDEMPRVNGEPCGVILNPYSIIGRKIPSVVMETGLSNVAVRLYEIVTEMINTGRKDEILPLLNKYYDKKFQKMRITEFLRKYKEQGLNLFSFDVGCFSKYTPEIIQKWMNELGVSTSSEVEIPALEAADLDALKDAMSEEEFESYKESLKGKYVKIDRPLMYGYNYIIKLYHVPEAANKVTSDMNDNKYGQPILGGGKYRREGELVLVA